MRGPVIGKAGRLGRQMVRYHDRLAVKIFGKRLFQICHRFLMSLDCMLRRKRHAGIPNGPAIIVHHMFCFHLHFIKIVMKFQIRP